jgi:hypothetical protein
MTFVMIRPTLRILKKDFDRFIGKYDKSEIRTQSEFELKLLNGHHILAVTESQLERLQGLVIERYL